jgi:tetratricopeptide (TPR) repeat protein
MSRDSDPSEEAETLASPLSESAGGRVGRYRLLQQIGEGGFGVVFLAEQTEPVKRQVALKIVKLGMDTRQVVARFEQERQALALMDHPHIARVIDAGATESGRPYFVMELVRGQPITEFCERHSLPIRDRLRLLIQVCQAVQHAHQKGLIHRDLKPSNVLVAMQDGEPVPKVIDFGIAKATAAKLTDLTLFTEQHQMIGTPGYMSPEQAEGSLDIDTRTDIYSLGAIAYELVTGTTPFDLQQLKVASPLELVRLIRDVDPPSPSRRVSQIATVATVAARRPADVNRVVARVHRDLDWIVLKAIDKDRSRRYETANEFALDLERYLAGEAVLAVPPSTAYRLRKLFARHTVAVVAAGVVLLALVVGLAGTLWQASVAARERDASRREAASAKAVTDFVIASLRSQDVNAQGQQDMTVATAMNQAAARLAGGDLKEQPEIRGLLLRTISDVLNNNGKSAAALQLAQQALDLERRTHAGEHEHIAAAMHAVGSAQYSLGRFDDAEATLREGAAMLKRRGVETADLVELINDWAGALIGLDRYKEAIPPIEEALQIGRRLFPGGHRDIAISLGNLALCRKNLGDLEGAEREYVKTIETYRQLIKGDHPDIAILLGNLGSVRTRLKRYPEALAALEEALAMDHRIFKEDHFNTAGALMQLSGVYEAMDRLPEAEDRAAECAAMLARLYPDGHPYTSSALAGLSRIRLARGNAAGAVTAAGQAVAIERHLSPAGSMPMVGYLQRLARAQAAARQFGPARSSAREAAAMIARLAPADTAGIARSKELIATIEKGRGGK